MKARHISTIFFTLLVLFAVTTTSCRKDEDNPNGSFSLTLGSQTFTKLTLPVTYKESSHLLTFEGKDNLGNKLSFLASGIGDVGETVHIDGNNVTLTMTIENGNPGSFYTASSGTITRETNTKITVDVKVKELFDETEIPLTGTIHIGVIL